MEYPKEENEKLIGKLIKKRKQENAAFKKLLSAINNQSEASLVPERKPKPK